MIKHVNAAAVTLLQKIYGDDDCARNLLDWAANRTNDSAETSLDRMMQVGKFGRLKAVELAKSFDEAGCGDFVIGRRGWKSRFKWKYSLRSVGLAAQGKTSSLESVDPEIIEDAEDQQTVPEDASFRKLSIAEAKEGLAAQFKVSPDAIDIVIRG